MSDVAPSTAPAPNTANGAPPAAPQKPIAPKPTEPVKAAPPPEVDDSEEYVVDGKKVRLSKAQRLLHFQKSATADKRLQEATEKQKALEELEKLFESDPEAYFAKKGKDGSKFIAEHLAKKAKLELMTPEQRESLKLQQERDEYKAKLDAAEKKETEAKQAEVDKRNFQALEEQLIEAADKHGIDTTPDALESLCEIALEYVEHQVPISADQIAKEHVRREREHVERRDKKLLTLLEGKKLLAYLGDATLAKVKAAMASADAESLKEIPAPQARPKVPVKAHERTVKGYVREADFDKKFLK